MRTLTDGIQTLFELSNQFNGSNLIEIARHTSGRRTLCLITHNNIAKEFIIIREENHEPKIDYVVEFDATSDIIDKFFQFSLNPLMYLASDQECVFPVRFKDKSSDGSLHLEHAWLCFYEQNTDKGASTGIRIVSTPDHKPATKVAYQGITRGNYVSDSAIARDFNQVYEKTLYEYSQKRLHDFVR